MKEEGEVEARQKFKGLLISVTNSSLSVTHPISWAFRGGGTCVRGVLIS